MYESSEEHALAATYDDIWLIAGVRTPFADYMSAPAIRALLKKTNLELSDIARLEINEAFGAQYRAVEKELDLDRARVNVNGGAIAIGHPLAPSGVRLTTTVARELQRINAEFGIASACAGGGQGVAILLQRAA